MARDARTPQPSAPTAGSREGRSRPRAGMDVRATSDAMDGVRAGVRTPRPSTDAFLVATIHARRRVAKWPVERRRQYLTAELRRLRAQRL